MPIYMKITQNGLPVIQGDATAKGHENWIELSSVQMGKSRSITEIVITKVMDSTSSALFLRSVNGEEVTIQIDFVIPGEGSAYLSFTLQDALISGYQVGGTRSGPTENLTLTFTKLTFDRQGTGPDVSDKAKGRMRGWDLLQGTR